MDDNAYKHCIDNITQLQQQLEEEEQKLFTIMAMERRRKPFHEAVALHADIGNIAHSATQIAC